MNNFNQEMIDNLIRDLERKRIALVVKYLDSKDTDDLELKVLEAKRKYLRAKRQRSISSRNNLNLSIPFHQEYLEYEKQLAKAFEAHEDIKVAICQIDDRIDDHRDQKRKFCLAEFYIIKEAEDHHLLKKIELEKEKKDCEITTKAIKVKEKSIAAKIKKPVTNIKKSAKAKK